MKLSLEIKDIFSLVGAIKSSATAKVPTTSPVTNFGRIFFLISSFAKLIIASVNKYTEEE